MDHKPGPGRPPKSHLIPIEKILLLPKSMRPRVEESQQGIERYTFDMEREDADFPSITVYKGQAGAGAGMLLTASGAIADIEKDDQVFVLSDGYHRLFATIGIERPAPHNGIRGVIKMGSWRDAMWAALGSNHEHGIPLTNADKRRSVTLVLEDKQWGRQSARSIADYLHVSSTFVDQLKKERATANALQSAPTKSEKKVVIDKRGREMQTKNIGKTKKHSTATGELPKEFQPYLEALARGETPPPIVAERTPDAITPASTSEEWIDSLRAVISDARSALVGAAWKRFVGEALDLVGKLDKLEVKA